LGGGLENYLIIESENLKSSPYPLQWGTDGKTKKSRFGESRGGFLFVKLSAKADGNEVLY
jgi:hypothetical protein